jgi:hypothetical protein
LAPGLGIGNSCSELTEANRVAIGPETIGGIYIPKIKTILRKGVTGANLAVPVNRYKRCALTGVLTETWSTPHQARENRNKIPYDDVGIVRRSPTAKDVQEKSSVVVARHGFLRGLAITALV